MSDTWSKIKFKSTIAIKETFLNLWSISFIIYLFAVQIVSNERYNFSLVSKKCRDSNKAKRENRQDKTDEFDKFVILKIHFQPNDAQLDAFFWPPWKAWIWINQIHKYFLTQDAKKFILLYKSWLDKNKKCRIVNNFNFWRKKVLTIFYFFTLMGIM